MHDKHFRSVHMGVFLPPYFTQKTADLFDVDFYLYWSDKKKMLVLPTRIRRMIAVFIDLQEKVFKTITRPLKRSLKFEVETRYNSSFITWVQARAILYTQRLCYRYSYDDLVIVFCPNIALWRKSSALSFVLWEVIRLFSPVFGLSGSSVTVNSIWHWWLIFFEISL